jgi:transposase
VNEVTIAVVLDGMDLTDAQWTVLEPLFRPPRRADGRGRPWAETRAVLNGVLWILRTGAPWHDLPRRYPPYQTCHRRFQTWQRTGVLERVLQGLAEDLRDRGQLDLSEAFIDASFSSAKKGAPPSALLGAVKAAKSWRSATAMVFLSPSTWPALRRMKSASSTPPSPRRSSTRSPRD